MSEQMEMEQNDPQVEDVSSPEAKLHQCVGRTESKTPGRMRLRVHPELRTPESMAKIKEDLESHPDIDEVHVNHRTGSVVIKHSPEHDSHKLFWEAIGEVDLLAEVAFDVPDEIDGEDPTQKVEQQLADLAYSVDKSIYNATGQNLHLGLLIPAAVAGIGVAQIAVYGLGLELLPGPILLWIAYDIYRRIGKEPPFVSRDKQDPQTDEISDVPVEAGQPVAA